MKVICIPMLATVQLKRTDAESTVISINWWLDQENAVYKQDEILLCCKKKHQNLSFKQRVPLETSGLMK